MTSEESYGVLGGEGFLGQAIVQALLAKHPSQRVASFGLTQRTFTDGYRFFRTDVTAYDDILKSFKNSGVTTVFHTVSPHTTATEELCEKVNIHGTKAIIQACIEAGVSKLVFTSSVTACFDGSSGLINADERMPIIVQTKDFYARTKAEAERTVLASNGKDGLLTCALRCGGIIGPGDRQVIPGFINVYKDGQSAVQLGDNLNLFDMVHVKNVAHAHLLAAERLALPPLSPEVFASRLPPVSSTVPYRPVPTSTNMNPDPKTPPPVLPAHRNRFDQFAFVNQTPTGEPNPLLGVAGQVFVITNGEPVPFWSFARAVYFAYSGKTGYTIPLPASLGMAVATVADAWNWLIGVKKEGGLTRAHVQYVLSELYFNIEKARRVLGYEPLLTLEEGIRDAVEAYKAEEAKSKKSA
ncbi:3-beta hydroxysteroid dehydrogenase/isomerase [Meredithblackwellia eburnea MCA 4105]